MLDPEEVNIGDLLLCSGDEDRKICYASIWSKAIVFDKHRAAWSVFTFGRNLGAISFGSLCARCPCSSILSKVNKNE